MAVKILEVISSSSKNNKGEYFKLVCAPWFENSNPKLIVSTKPYYMTKVAENLSFLSAKDLVNKA